MRIRFWGVSALIGLAASVCWGAAAVRQPVGVYMHVDQGDAVGSYPGKAPSLTALHAYLQNLYAGYLANGAISGITFGAHWDKIQLASGTAASSFDWSYLDDVFTAASAAHKTVQLILTPGVDAPAWLMAQIPSCDALFTKGSAPADCGSVTFTVFPEQQRADTNVIPLPWNTVYQQAWAGFLTSVNARYGSNPALVAVAIAGPICASDEMILPTTLNTTAAQATGLAPDDMWAALIQHSFPNNAAYQNSDQVFIDAWEQAIDSAESIFTGITLFLGPDSGNDLPTFGTTSVTPHADNTLFALECSTAPKTNLLSCEAKTEILSYFVTVKGSNVKGTQVGGMTALSPVDNGSIGVPGVKTLTSLTPAPSIPFSGGAEFDYPATLSTTIQAEGCPLKSGDCMGLTPEEATYNVMTVFFDMTPAAAFYGGTVGTESIQYVDVPFFDFAYVQATPCPPVASPSLGYTSIQDLYARANRDLLEMAGQTTTLPAPTCTKTAPAPVISLVANAEGEAQLIAPNTWVEIKGSNLGTPGDSRIWQQSDFSGNGLTMPTQLDGVSATVNGKAAFVYYISPLQVNILTPPDAMLGVGCGAVELRRTDEPRVHGADASVGAVVLRVRRRALRGGGARQWHVHRADDVIPRGDHAGETGRDDSALWQRIWSDQFGGTERVDYAIGGVDTHAGGDDRRDRGEGAIRGIGGAGRVSVQRGCADWFRQWRSDDYGDLRRRIDSGGDVTDGA